LLRNACGAGFCGCLCAGLLNTNDANAETEKKDTPIAWHAPFARRRYLALMQILYEQLGPEEFSKTIQKLGRECSKGIKMISDCKGKPDEYFEKLKKRWNEDSFWDKEKGVITIASAERTECTCPLIDTKKMPGYVCDCSLGWQKQTFETVLGKKVDVKIEESLLRGERRCVFKVTVDPASKDSSRLVKLTVLYDNYKNNEFLQAKWGFACLIEGLDQTVLFDTGGSPDVLAANCKVLNIDPKTIDAVVISHMHWDHVNGLDWLVNKNDRLAIYLPDSATDEKVEQLKQKAGTVERVSEMKTICDSLFTIGTLEHQIPEQSLYLKTSNGLVVITGCSHPGIVRILKKAKVLSKQNIKFVFGGFHLGNKSSEQVEKIIQDIKELGVEKIGPTHCTGDTAIESFKKAWGKNFISMGVGKKFTCKSLCN
jgi:7,8-dihydropterin-6-yl-methyl-4-(beta-D-ribofuranosyl)aminobenzene 5'-phosphate synthase